ncbi:MAG: type IV pilin, partial [Thermoplasmata archaeon]
MKISPFGSRKTRDDGVSEVVGSLFLLVMTVAFFSVILLWVYSFDSPDSEARVVLYPTMERINSTSANITIVHRGGEPMSENAAQIIVTIQNTTTRTLLGPYNYSDGWEQPGDWSIGDTWAHIFTNCPEDSQVVISVVDKTEQKLVLRSELQRGIFAGGSAYPIIGIPIVLPDDQVIADGKDEFFIRAVAADYDNDLPHNGLVADLTPIWPGLGSVVLEHRGFGVYESTMVTCPTTAMPGVYDLNVTATDSKGHTDTNWASITIKSPDKSPPLVIITNPTSGEIAAGTANRIIASYTDPNGINTKTVTMSVWEDGIPLDTTSKIVTDSRVTFKPLGGFRTSALYRVNVTVADNNGNVGDAETVFRMSTYSQPGNPQGETSFDLMDRNWTFTTTFWHDDLIRVQLWSEVLERVDFSELRLVKTDSSNVYIYKDRFMPNLSVPPPSMSFPFYVYDATIDIQLGGAYGAPVPPGYYTLEIIAEYAAEGLMFTDKITIAILYEDGSMPNAGNFLTFNVTGIWISSTDDFNWQEMLYIEVHTEDPLEEGDTKLEKAIISISEIYGDNILYKELPASQVTYVGLTPDGHVYRMQVPLTGTLDGAQWFYGANWYPIEVAMQVVRWHWRPHPVFGFKLKKTEDIAFEAANQIKITRPSDIAVSEDYITIYHSDGTTLDVNATVKFGEDLFINVTVWNYGEVDVLNAKLKIWAISQGVTLDYWEMDKSGSFWDPNDNGVLDSAVPNNFVNIEVTWNTSKTGFDQYTLERAKIVVHVDILEPIIGGYGSPPIPETNYNNNDAEVELVPESTGLLTVSNPGYITPALVDVGRMFFQVDEVLLTASGGGVRLLGMNLTLFGSAVDSDVATVRVYRDINGNGFLDPNDYLVDQDVFVGNRMHVDVAMYIRDGRQIRFFIMYDIAPAAVAGRNLGSSIDTTNDVYVDPTATVDPTGFSIVSELATITGNVNELTGKIVGPHSAFPGYPVVYRLDLNAYNTDPVKPLEGTLTITDLRIHVTGSASIQLVWLLDHNLDIIGFQPSAPTVTFTNMAYVVPAWWTRPMFVVLNVDPSTASGTIVGISIKDVDVRLSTPMDLIDPALDLTMTSTIAVMSDYFEWRLGDPLLELDNTAIYNMNMASNDPTVPIEISGLFVEWSADDMPAYTLRVYIDGVLKFEDDGLNHIGNGIYIPFATPAQLDGSDSSFRIEFNIHVTKKQPKKKIY